MTPREHIAAAIECGRDAQAIEQREHGGPNDDREIAYAEGAAAGHAFRALEIGYDEEQALWQVVKNQRDVAVAAEDRLEFALAMGCAACERTTMLEQALEVETSRANDAWTEASSMRALLAQQYAECAALRSEIERRDAWSRKQAGF